MSKQRKPRAPASAPRRHFLTPGVVLGAIVLFAALAAWPLYWWQHDRSHHTRRVASAPSPNLLGGKFRFTNVAAQAREFIGYNSTIHLTAEQEAIKRKVLASMPAACCRDSNAYTCCCTCNLSKSIWGLSNYVLATHHATAEQLREVVTAWKDFTNPAGYDGSSCYSGGCSRSFHENGCGGMSEASLVL